MKRLFILSLVLLITGVLAGGWWIKRDVDKYMHSPIHLTQISLNYTVQPGTTFKALLRDLELKNIIDKPYYLEYTARSSGLTSKIKAGEYRIYHQSTPLELLELFVAGRVVQYSLTLIEGWSFEQVMESVSSHPRLIKTLTATGEQAILLSLGMSEVSAEGLFLPETYHFPSGTSDVEFLKRANLALTQILNEEWNNRKQNLPYHTPYEALIMASLIEKETAQANERSRIAGVFARRLMRDMKLQTDPTVIYAMGTNFNGNIRKKDLAIDSPYNTYVYKGLPPTPIALAGRESIHAALQPENGTELYFVARGDGSHYFSDTLQEHNKAVSKYQLKK